MKDLPEGATVLPPFDAALVDRLIKAYGIRDKTSLVLNLRSIQSGYDFAKNRTDKQPTTKESLRQIETIRATARRLRQQISGDPSQSIVHEWLHINIGGLGALENALADIEHCLADLSPEGLKQRSDVVSRDFLIARIGHLWQHYTGKAPTYSTARGKRGGSFIDFMTDVAYILGVDPSPLPERFARLKRKDSDR